VPNDKSANDSRIGAHGDARRAKCLQNHLLAGAASVSYDLNQLVDDKSFVVNTGANEDAHPGLNALQGLANCRVLPTAICGDNHCVRGRRLLWRIPQPRTLSASKAERHSQ